MPQLLEINGKICVERRTREFIRVKQISDEMDFQNDGEGLRCRKGSSRMSALLTNAFHRIDDEVE